MKKHMVGAIALSVCACGGQLSKDDAQKAWTATSSGLAGGTAMASNQAALTAGEPAFTISFEWECPQGGSAGFDRDYGVSGDYAAGAATAEFTFHVTYADCGIQDIVVDGTLDYALNYEGDQNNFAMVYDYNGNLSYSGAVAGACVIDMTGRLDMATGGGSLSLSMDYEGTICGYDAAETLNVSLAGAFGFGS